MKPDGGPVATVMDFGQSFPLDPPPRLKASEVLNAGADAMSFTVKDGVPRRLSRLAGTLPQHSGDIPVMTL